MFLKLGGPGSQWELRAAGWRAQDWTPQPGRRQQKSLGVLAEQFPQKRAYIKKMCTQSLILKVRNSPQWKYELKPWPHHNLSKNSKRNLLREAPHSASCYRLQKVPCSPDHPSVPLIHEQRQCVQQTIHYLSIRFWQERRGVLGRRIRENRGTDGLKGVKETQWVEKEKG